MFRTCLLTGVLVAIALLFCADALSQREVTTMGAPNSPNFDAYRADDIASQGGVSYSGELGLSIPLLTIPGRNGHNFPIVLHYSSNITQRQSASWVGLGWSLELGSVDRAVLGRFDEGPTPGADHGGLRANLPGWLISTSQEPIDQPDMYTLHLDGGSDQLIVLGSPQGASTFELHPFRYHPSWTVEGLRPTGSWIEKFTLIKEDGSRFIFGDDASAVMLFDCGVGSVASYLYPYRWGLKRIEYPDGAVTQVEYMPASPAGFYDDWYSTLIVDRSNPGGDAANLLGAGSGDWPIQYEGEYKTNWLKRERTWPVMISTDTHYALFIHSEPEVINPALPERDRFERTDSNRKLESIILYDHAGVELKRVTFEYAGEENTRAAFKESYELQPGQENDVTMWQGDDEECERLNNNQLTLVKVTIQSGEGPQPLKIPSYVFSYYENPVVDWYAQAKLNEGRLVHNFPGYHVDRVFARAWRLRQMIVPTGANITYDYEALGDPSFRVYYDPEGRLASPPLLPDGITWDYKLAPRSRLSSKTIIDPVGVDQTWLYTYGECVMDPPSRPIGMNFVPAYAQEPSENQEKLYKYHGGCSIGHRWVQVTNPDGSWEKTYFTSSYVHEPLAGESYPDVISEPGSSPDYDELTVVSNAAKRGLVWKRQSPSGEELNQYEFTQIDGSSNRIEYFAVNYPGRYRHRGSENVIWACVGGVQTVRDGVTSMVIYEYNATNRLLWKKHEQTWLAPPYRETTYEYAFQTHSAMGNARMMSQLHSTKVAGAAGVGSENITMWAEFSGHWLPSEEWDQNPPNGPPLKTLTYDSYDSFGNLLQTTDARGGVTKYYYGTNENPFPSGQSALHPWSRLTGTKRVVDEGSSLSSSYKYDHYGNITETKDENGNTTSHEYDGLGRLTSIWLPGGLKQGEFSYAYPIPFSSSSPNSITMTNFRGENEGTTTKVFFDGLGYEAQKQFQFGNEDIVLHTRLDAMRRPMKRFKPFMADMSHLYYDIDALTHAIGYYSGLGVLGVGDYPYTLTEYLSDGTGRVSSEYPPGEAYHLGSRKRTHTYGTNSAGEFALDANTLFKTTLTDENPLPYTTETVEYTDRLGNLIASVQDPTGINAQTLFEYDAMGRVTKTTDPQGFVSEYTYNSRGLLIERQTVDGGIVRHMYDDNGNLRFSQDAVQTQGPGKFTYRKYDLLSRILEVGEEAFSQGGWGDLNPNSHDFPIGATATTRYFYDNALVAEPTASNLQGRVAAVSTRTGAVTECTYYSYDEVGRIEWISQHLDGIGQKKLTYEYDRQGNITREGVLDVGREYNNQYRFYEYDQMGRLLRVFTDQDPSGFTKVKQAEYEYLAGGQVRRLELGVAQGLDFSYNERDWLTQMNHEHLGSSWDPGGDGTNSFPVDRLGLRLGYDDISGASSLLGSGQNAQAQYTGNISWMVLNTSTLTNVGPSATADITGWVYGYDKMNRLTRAGFYFNPGSSWESSQAFDIDQIAYSPNGNIASMERWGIGATVMDDLTYHYTTGTNKLTRVADAVPAGTYTGDLDNQVTDNYTYDANGNATQDLSRLMTGAVYDYRNLPLQGTINGSLVKYRYDANGNRVCKEHGGTKNYYIRGVAGETVAVYDEDDNPLFWNLFAGGKAIGKLLP